MPPDRRCSRPLGARAEPLRGVGASRKRCLGARPLRHRPGVRPQRTVRDALGRGGVAHDPALRARRRRRQRDRRHQRARCLDRRLRTGRSPTDRTLERPDVEHCSGRGPRRSARDHGPLSVQRLGGRHQRRQERPPTDRALERLKVERAAKPPPATHADDQTSCGPPRRGQRQYRRPTSGPSARAANTSRPAPRTPSPNTGTAVAGRSFPARTSPAPAASPTTICST